MTDTSPPPGSTSQAKTIILAALSIVTVGLLIAGGMYWSLNRGAPRRTTADCTGVQSIGSVEGLTHDAKLSPYYGTIGGRCEYWIALRNTTELVAYKAEPVGRTCKIHYEAPKNGFLCDGKLVAQSALQTWPGSNVTTGPKAGSFEIDFGPNPSPGSTSGISTRRD